MKNMVKLETIRRIVGIIAMAAIIAFTMTACDPEGDDTPTGKTITFSLDKINATSFTLTVEGAVWDRTMDAGQGTNFSFIFLALGSSSTLTLYANNQTFPAQSTHFDFDRVSDTVVKFTLKNNYSDLTGTLTLPTEGVPLNSFAYRTDDYQALYDTPKAHATKNSITFP